MRTTRKVAIVLGVAALIAGSAPAFAQFDEPDPDLIPLAGLDDGGDGVMPGAGVMAFAQAPFGGDMPMFIAGPGGRMRPHGPGGCPPMDGCCPLDMLEGDNALTDQQYEKLYELKNGFMDKAGVKMAELGNTHRQMRDQLLRETIDKAKVKELQGRINEQKAALANLRLDHKLAGLEVLTDAQRKELRTNMVKGGMPGMHGMRGKFMKRMHKGECPKPG